MKCEDMHIAYDNAVWFLLLPRIVCLMIYCRLIFSTSRKQPVVTQIKKAPKKKIIGNFSHRFRSPDSRLPPPL